MQQRKIHRPCFSHCTYRTQSMNITPRSHDVVKICMYGEVESRGGQESIVDDDIIIIITYYIQHDKKDKGRAFCSLIEVPSLCCNCSCCADCLIPPFVLIFFLKEPREIIPRTRLQLPAPASATSKSLNMAPSNRDELSSDSENYDIRADGDDEAPHHMTESSEGSVVPYQQSSSWNILRRCLINLFLPFVNGLMLGFGELFAHEAAYRIGWSNTKVS